MAEGYFENKGAFDYGQYNNMSHPNKKIDYSTYSLPKPKDKIDYSTYSLPTKGEKAPTKDKVVTPKVNKPTHTFKKPGISPERQALAKKYGIDNYTGTAEQNNMLKEKAKMMKDKKSKSKVSDDFKQQVRSTKVKKEEPKEKASDIRVESTIVGKDGEADGNVHLQELNKTGDNFEGVVTDRADNLSDIALKEGQDKKDIEVAASKEKVARSDETREELLDVTGDFKDKQDDRYDEVEDITDRQENIANREANIAVAKAGRYGDIYSDGEFANIKNNIIQKYGTNILNAEQYALNTNRTIDNDLLNVGLKEVADKDKRDAFKDVLLDKENSYMLNAISEAANGDKQAIKDVAKFYETYIKLKADEEFVRAKNTERREGFQDEFESLDTEGKAGMLRDLSFKTPGYSLIADRIPSLINKYPNLSVSELEGKIAKIAELALTAKQQLPTIIAKSEEDRTDVEKDLLLTYAERGLEEQQRSDRDTSETIEQQELSSQGLNKTTGDIKDSSEDGKAVLERDKEAREEENKRVVSQEVDKPTKDNKPTRSNTSKRTVTGSQIKAITKKLNSLRGTSKYNAYKSAVKKMTDGIKSGSITYKK